MSVRAPAFKLQEGSSKRFLVVLGALAAVLAAWAVATSKDDSSGLAKGSAGGAFSSGQERSKAQPRSDPAEEVTDRPPFLAVTIRPYDLVKDSFAYKGKLVLFEPRDFPRFWDHQFIDYWPHMGGPVSGPGAMAGLEFDRKLSEKVAAYNVLGIMMGSGLRSQTQTVGQVIVMLPSRTSAPPNFERPWYAEPLGTATGTNAFGAAISVPLIRFWGYEGGSAQCDAIARDVMSADGSARGQYKDAMPQLNAWAACDPNSPEPLSYRAHASIELGRYDKALIDADRALRMGPHSGGFADDLNFLRGLAYAGLGQLKEAKADLDVAGRSEGAGARVYEALAEVCARMGDHEAARVAREKANQMKAPRGAVQREETGGTPNLPQNQSTASDPARLPDPAK